MSVWYWISLPAYTFALRAENGVVVQVPPIARWALGLSLRVVQSYFLNRGASFVRLADVPEEQERLTR